MFPIKEIKTLNPFEDRVGLVYARVSTKRQEVEGSGLTSQEDRCISHLKTIQVPFEKTFPDSYTGGGDFMKRPAMRALLDYIDNNHNQKFVVVFDDLKRFARDVEFHLKLRATFRARGVILRCLNYNFDETPEGHFVEVILAGAAELERQQNKRQVVQKMKARLEAGYWTFGSIRGYTMEKQQDHGKIAIPHATDGPLLKEALEGYATGTFVRPVDACKFLVQKGFWDRAPERNTEKFIGMLKEPFYAGEIEYLAWGVSRRAGKHQPLISKETFFRNQERLGTKKVTQRIRVDTSADFPFRGLITCATCDGHLTGTWGNGRKKKKYAYYLCQERNCPAFRRTIPRKEIEDGFQELVTSRTLSSEGSKLLKQAFDEAWNEEISDFNALFQNEKKRQEDLQQRITKLTDLIIQSSSDTLRKTFESELEKCSEQLEQLPKSNVQMDMSIPYRTALEKATKFLKSPYQYWLKADVVEKQQLFFFLFERKLAYSRKEGYRTENNPVITRLFEEFTTANTLDVEMRGKMLNRMRICLERFWVLFQNSPQTRTLLS